jgi:FkbH-like protein
MAVFDNRPEMLLRRSDFTDWEISWEPKSVGVARLLQRLNLTPYGTVFLDDSRLERQEIKSFHPEIIVPELSDNPDLWVRYLAESKLFSVGVVEEEDLRRSEMYRTERARQKLETEFGNYDDFLKHLQLVITPEKLSEANIGRIHQLINKTNQFNLTGRRMSDSELRKLMNLDDHIVLGYTLSDRYGNYGLVSVVVLEGFEGAMRIGTWVMSCRAMGRDVEMAIFADVANRVSKSHSVIWAEYVETGKNAPVQNLLSRLGFNIKGEKNFCGRKLTPSDGILFDVPVAIDATD